MRILTYGLTLGLLLGPIVSVAQEFYKEKLSQRVTSKVTAGNGAGLFQIVDYDKDGREVIQRVGELPSGTEFSFKPVDRIIRPLVVRENNARRASPGGYFGSIDVNIRSLPRSKRSNIEQLETSELYIYEWSINKTPYLRQVFDIEPLDKMFQTNESFEWDRISTKGLWTTEAARLVQTYGEDLLYNPPSDIEDFCPNYENLETQDKTSFWIHLINSVARRESAFDPLVGNDEGSFGNTNQGVISRGLMQISYGSIGRPYRNAGCDVQRASELHDPIANIQCGVAIFNHWVKTDNCISCKSSGRSRGIARYWSTLREPYTVSCSVCSSGETTVGYKNDIIEEVSNTSICKDPNEGSRLRRFFRRFR